MAETTVLVIGDSQTHVYRKQPDVVNSVWEKIQIRDETATGSLRRIDYNGSYFLIISDSGQIYKSNDQVGDSWNILSDMIIPGEITVNIGNGYPTGLVYNDVLGVWVVIYKDGRVLYSSDGTIWRLTTDGIPSHKNLFGISYGQGVFIIVGEGGIMLKSPDGISWTESIIDPNPPNVLNTPYFDVKYANGIWVLIGLNYLITSTDAFTTYQRVFSLEQDTYNRFGKIIYGGNGFWLITGDQRVRYSFDNGMSWNKSQLKFIASSGGAFDGLRWYVVNSNAAGSNIMQNSTLEESFGFPDEESELPLVINLTNPYVNGAENVSLVAEYPIHDWEPSRQLLLVKGNHWEEMGTVGQLSNQIRLLSPPNLIYIPLSILALNQLNKEFVVSGDWTTIFESGLRFEVQNSTTNNGIYTTRFSVYDSGADETVITVFDSIASSFVDGEITDDKQLIDRHTIAKVISLFDWEPTLHPEFVLYDVGTNHITI